MHSLKTKENHLMQENSLTKTKSAESTKSEVWVKKKTNRTYQNIKK